MSNRYFHKENCLYDTKDNNLSITFLNTIDCLNVMNILNCQESDERRQFAAMAMQGICSATSCSMKIDSSYSEIIAKESVIVADALIKELNK